MQGDALDVLGQRILLRRDLGPRIAHDAGDWRRLRQALLLHQSLESPVAAAAGRDLELAGLGAFGVEDRPDVEALQEPAPGDVLGQILDRDAGLQAPDVGLAEHQLVEGDVARGAEGDLLNGLCHEGYSATDGRETLSRPPIRHVEPAQPSHSFPAKITVWSHLTTEHLLPGPSRRPVLGERGASSQSLQRRHYKISDA